MRKFYILFVVCLAATVFSSRQAWAQDAPAKKDSPDNFKSATGPTYRLSFSIFELQEGKRTNQRDYSLLLTADNGGGNKIKIGTKIPLDVGENKITYTDVGFEVECSAVETTNNKLAIRVELGLSSFPIADQNNDPRSAGNRPVLRGISQRLRTVLTPGKPQIITSMDDTNSNRRFQVEATATKVE